METATATWSNALTDSATLEPSHAVHTPPRTTWMHDASDRISSPELDDTAISYDYHHHHHQSQQQQQQPQQGVCRFVHTQCEKELFTTEYLRSNKASGHKNLRCFPHCCGGHNPKSFCGSGLVVECFLPKCQIVLGRFEEVAKPKPKVSSATSSSSTSSSTAGAAPVAATDDSDAATTIVVGHEYSRKELFDEVKVPDQPFGKWFRGTIVPKAADRACFLLNGNRQSWHYGWQSSRLNCKNLHVFKVYVFNQSDTSPSALQCVAELASPAFRISSSRKARKTVRSPVMHPLASPTDHTTMPLSSGAAENQSGASSSRVPSIDELLSKSSAIAASERFPSQQRRSLVEPLTLLEQQQQHARAAAAATASSGYQRGYPTLQRHSIAVSSLHAAAAAAAAAAVAADNAHARRERKRLTRSASLKSDYYATVAFPPLQPPVQQQPTPTPSFSLAATHPPPQFAYQQPQQTQQRMTPLPSVAYMNGTRMLNARRSSLAALPMPSPAPLAPQPHASSSGSGGGGATAVTTPIMDMMQLRLESPHPQDAYRQQHVLQQQQRLSLSAFNPSTSLHQHAYASSKPQSFTRRDFAASWSAGGPGPLSAAPAPAPPVYFPMIPASSPEGYLNRKRNRSTDSDKGLLAAIQASEALLASARGDGAAGMGHHAATTDGATAMDTGDEPALASVDETDSVDLHRRARVLQLAFTIVKRIHRFEEVSKSSASASTPRVYRHSFEMVIPASRSSSGSSATGASAKAPTLVQIPLSNHHILHLCSSLVSVCTSLLRNGVLLDIRQRLVEYAQAGVDLYSAYAQIVDFIDDAVHELVCQLPKRQRARDANGSADGDDAEQWDLYDLLKNAEAWLIQEPWWCATDDDDDIASRCSNQHDSSSSSSPHADLPYYGRFADFYEAIQSALPSPRDLEVAASLRDAALNGVRGLTGEWVRQGSLADLSAQRPKTVAASASASASLSWLARQIHGHMTQVFHLTETATTMTLALPQSLISSEAVFLFDLDRQEPTVVVPHDYFPFGWTRKRLLVAYRAWRVRGIGDENGSAVAVQFMRWPDDSRAQDDDAGASDDESVDGDDDDDEPEEEPLEPRRRRSSAAATAALLRTRVTIYFSVFSHNRLQVRTIVEGSMGAAVPSPSSSAAGSPPPASVRRGQPTEADMMQYFKSPSSWELMSQVTHEYERKSLREVL